MTKIGDFQSNVGKFGADVHVMAAYIGGVIVGLIGIVLVIAGITKKPDPDDRIKREYDSNVKAGMIVFGILFIIFAVGGIFLSKWWQNQTRTSRTAAQIGGLATEAAVTRRMLN